MDALLSKGVLNIAEWLLAALMYENCFLYEKRSSSAIEEKFKLYIPIAN